VLLLSASAVLTWAPLWPTRQGHMFPLSGNLLQPDDILFLQVSDEEDDEMSAIRHISSREALTLIQPIRQAGRKWGRRMPSPVDDPATSIYLDDEGEELEGKEEAASAVSSKLDPTITNLVSRTSLLAANCAQSRRVSQLEAASFAIQQAALAAATVVTTTHDIKLAAMQLLFCDYHSWWICRACASTGKGCCQRVLSVPFSGPCMAYCLW